MDRTRFCFYEDRGLRRRVSSDNDRNTTGECTKVIDTKLIDENDGDTCNAYQKPRRSLT
jgi:hypothetical protein